jgi:hypothetical protein
MNTMTIPPHRHRRIGCQQQPLDWRHSGRHRAPECAANAQRILAAQAKADRNSQFGDAALALKLLKQS